ncbi:unnamed protein product [marine sediment metagenome]|uniref:Uncharacterized protein n=1 Tax=marine sediment metagenome TaxID=412755 RepID=X0WAI4_9ZZZZ
MALKRFLTIFLACLCLMLVLAGISGCDLWATPLGDTWAELCRPAAEPDVGGEVVDLVEELLDVWDERNP